MKIKEAIDILKIVKAEIEWNYPIDYAEALDMAIIALKERDVEWKTIPIDTILWVKKNFLDEEGEFRSFAKYEDGKIYTYPKEKTSDSFKEDEDKLEIWEIAEIG